MRYYFAPLEGVTNALYRSVHRQHFSPLDRYFTPFFVPNNRDGLGAKDCRELLPERNPAQPLIPQLLCNDAAAFCRAAERLACLGYSEVNLNLGCPSGTVVSKGRGAGFLAQPERLRSFFDEIFSKSPLPISVKSRIGLAAPAEFPALMALFNDYPLTELILHPKLRIDFYRNPANQEAFAYALSIAKMPLCYNGDLFTPAQIQAFSARFPTVQTLMLGRGLIANPALVEQAEGLAPLDKERLRAFHEDLLCRYQEVLSGEAPLLHKMKELWSYMIWLFPAHQKAMKRLRKAQTLIEFKAAVMEIFQNLPLSPELGFDGSSGA